MAFRGTERRRVCLALILPGTNKVVENPTCPDSGLLEYNNLKRSPGCWVLLLMEEKEHTHHRQILQAGFCCFGFIDRAELNLFENVNSH